MIVDKGITYVCGCELAEYAEAIEAAPLVKLVKCQRCKDKEGGVS